MTKNNIVYIGIGTNQGNKLGNIQKAFTLIEKIHSTKIESFSSIYITKPFGYLKQDDFLNMVIKISTGKDIKSFFKKLKIIENKLGRTKTIKWGPRQIDLDILFFNDQIFSDEDLTVPHKGITERDFVLVPLAEIQPDFVHPALNEKIADICNTVLQKQIISKIEYSKRNKLKKQLNI